ncbi:hypothetical protein PR048_014627 [Dryococelus australis]|uniref:Uncharacterized protein n=1 Tax=Dryococelus australis TaxID=614101 RepID=A0ABQ9HES8_9NEOP|nr:hypothetical protein PR048_014627 [Dryococelus australis]
MDDANLHEPPVTPAASNVTMTDFRKINPRPAVRSLVIRTAANLHVGWACPSYLYSGFSLNVLTTTFVRIFSIIACIALPVLHTLQKEGFTRLAPGYLLKHRTLTLGITSRVARYNFRGIPYALPFFQDQDISVFAGRGCANGNVNRHNYVNWAEENPHIVVEPSVNIPGLTLWCGMSTRGRVGPFFFDRTEAGGKLPCRIEGKNLIAFLQQDGATLHYHRGIRSLLDERFDGRWVGRRGNFEYPPSSPDLMLLRLSSVGNSGKHCVRHKDTDAGYFEIRDRDGLIGTYVRKRTGFPAINKTPPHHMLTSQTSATYCTFFSGSTYKKGSMWRPAMSYTNMVPTYHVVVHTITNTWNSKIQRSHITRTNSSSSDSTEVCLANMQAKQSSTRESTWKTMRVPTSRVVRASFDDHVVSRVRDRFLNVPST